ncbi:MAG: glycine cleavage system aminomethyltransferase GcvT [Salinisphaera sp.]|jgi:aminomethyltransferase|nr:glycine cleavage system aminomethyltransferase GcvT [Salinisphaera sp.]
MAKQTPIYDHHVASGAKLVNFAGWDMPINYGSQIEEHKVVREAAGMFDVSHMRPVDIEGANARDFLRRVLANDVAKIDEPGRALYSCMLNARGGVVDDLIVYHLAENWYRVVVNAATTEKDMAWLKSQAEDFGVEVTAREDLAIIAVQGPNARELAAGVLGESLAEAAMALSRFRAAAEGDWSVGRTGYTGEDGFEIVLPAASAAECWKALLEAGVQPVGLGARDTLRLEAGLNLYGHDMNEDTTPGESNLGWTVAMNDEDRHFVGREALLMAQESGHSRRLVGLVLDGRGVIRDGAPVRERPGDEGEDGGREVDPDEAEGQVTSGSFAPTLSRSIALARVPADWAEQDALEVWIRDRWHAARVVKPPFVREGKIRISL